MKRRFVHLIFLLAVAVPATLSFAQEGHEKKAGETHEAAAHEEEGGLELWKWANFLLLAGGLGYLIARNAGPFFAARSVAIRKDMDESTRQRQAAEASVAEVERRLATLETEIAEIRAESGRDLQATAERLTRQTADQIARIQAQAAQEIAGASKVARLELKRYFVDLAIRLAEQKVSARMTPTEQNKLVESFLRDVQ